MTLRRALRLCLRILSALMVGGSLAIGPRLHQPRPVRGAQVVLVIEASGAKS